MLLLVCEKAERKILNAGYDFVRLAPSAIRTQFAGVPMKVLLSEGETLYRFLGAGFDGTPSDLWLPLESYHHLRRMPTTPEWAVWKNANSPSRVAPAAFCRATLLNKAYGFRGCVRSTSSHVVTLDDMLTRSMLWIPGLSAADFFLRSYSLGDSPQMWRP